MDKFDRIFQIHSILSPRRTPVDPEVLHANARSLHFPVHQWLASISQPQECPMRKVNIHEAKTTLSQLVEAAEAGEDVLIARAGRPVARHTRVRTGRKGIKLGTLKGMFKRVSSDFDAPLPQSVLSTFEKDSIEP